MADWHKITSADWVNLTYQVADPQLASGLMMMMMHCLNEGGLPDNNEEISDITRLPLETILAIRDLRCVKRVTETRDGRLFFNVVSEMLAERTEMERVQNLLRGNWSQIRKAILKRDNYICGYCGSQARCVDHIFPRILGGDNTTDNLIAACLQCNSRKGGRTLKEARMSILWFGGEPVEFAKFMEVKS